MCYFTSAEEVNSKTVKLVYVFASVSSFLVMRISHMSYSVDVESIWFQYTPNLLEKKFKFSCSKCHRIKHVRIATAKRFIVEWKRVPHIVTDGSNRLWQSQT